MAIVMILLSLLLPHLLSQVSASVLLSRTVWGRLLWTVVLVVGWLLAVQLDGWGMWLFLSIFLFGLPMLILLLALSLACLAWTNQLNRLKIIYYHVANSAAWYLFYLTLVHSGRRILDESGTSFEEISPIRMLLTQLIFGGGLLAYQWLFGQRLRDYHHQRSNMQ